MVGCKLPFLPLLQAMRLTDLSQTGYKCTTGLEVPLELLGRKNEECLVDRKKQTFTLGIYLNIENRTYVSSMN